MGLKKTAVRTLLVAVYLPAAFITPVAYFFLPLALLSGLEAARKGTGFVGILVSLVSLLALFSLWRIWSIGIRVWMHMAYVPPIQGSRIRDGSGLLSGWIALAGLAVLNRFEEPWGLGMGLVYSLFVMPAALIATLAFFFSAQVPAANKPLEPTR